MPITRVAHSVALLCALSACDSSRVRPAVVVEDSAGVPVFRVTELPALDDPDWQWSLRLERAVRTGARTFDEEPLLYNPQRVLRLSDGTLVVLDAGEPRLAVVSAERDSVLARFGRTGQGPGEVLSSMGLLSPADGGSFWLVDPGNQRRTRYSLGGELLDEARLELGGMGGLAVQRPGTHQSFISRVFMSVDSGPAYLEDRVLRLDASEGRFTEVAAMPPRHPTRAMNTSDFPFFAPQGGFAPLQSGGVIVGRSDAARFTHVDDEGSVLGIIDLPLRPRPLDPASVPQLAAQMGEDYAPAAQATRDDFYEAFPVWAQIWPLRDSVFAIEHTWLASPDRDPAPARETRVWRMFSVRGEYAGVLRLPPGFGYPYQFDGDRLVGVTRDSLGVATIEAYILVEPGKD